MGWVGDVCFGDICLRFCVLKDVFKKEKMKVGGAKRLCGRRHRTCALVIRTAEDPLHKYT